MLDRYIIYNIYIYIYIQYMLCYIYYMVINMLGLNWFYWFSLVCFIGFSFDVGRFLYLHNISVSKYITTIVYITTSLYAHL